MIVQEHIEGIRGNDLAAIDNAGLDRKVLAIRPGVPSDRARKPFIDRAMRERYQPVETARRAQQTLSDLFGLVTSMPRDLARLVKDARHGRLRVDLDLKRLDRFGDRVHSAMDRATIGIMTASLVVGSSIAMTIAEGPHLFGVSLLTYCGLVGYLVAFVNSLWIIFSIYSPTYGHRPVVPAAASDLSDPRSLLELRRRKMRQELLHTIFSAQFRSFR